MVDDVHMEMAANKQTYSLPISLGRESESRSDILHMIFNFVIFIAHSFTCKDGHQVKERKKKNLESTESERSLRIGVYEEKTKSTRALSRFFSLLDLKKERKKEARKLLRN